MSEFTTEKITLDVKFGTLSIGEYTMGLGVEVPKSKLSLDKFDTLLAGSRLRVEILPNAHGQDPDQKQIPGTFEKVEAEVDSKRFSVGIDSIKFRLTFPKDGVDHGLVDSLVKKQGQIRLQRVGDALTKESKKAIRDAGGDESHPDVAAGKDRPHGTPLLGELAKMMKQRGKDVGWKTPVSALISKNLKAHCKENGVECGKNVGMTEEQIETIQGHFGIGGELMVAKLEQCISKNMYWYKDIKGFGLGKVDKLSDAITLFRQCYPIPENEEDRGDVDIDKIVNPEKDEEAAEAEESQEEADSKIDRYRAAVKEGMEANIAGKKLADCPYLEGTPECQGWVNGHERVDDENSFGDGVDEDQSDEDILTQGGDEEDDENDDQEDLEEDEEDDE